MSDPLRDLAENAVSACLPFLPLEGSWGDGYRLSQYVHSEVRAPPEEWADAALAIAELHKALAIEPEYEYRACWPKRNGVPLPTLEKAARMCVVTEGPIGKGWLERRVKAGPWERVER